MNKTESLSKKVLDRSQLFLDKTKILNQKESDELVDLLSYHEWRYYVLAKPIITDREYDFLYHLLKKYEEVHPEHRRSDSPTQRVGSDLSSDFPKQSHLSPLLSLDNSYNALDLLSFDKQVKKLLEKNEREDIDYHVEAKLDGISLAVVYENDMFISAITRGNGYEGEDISNNVKTISSLPLKVEFSSLGINRIELRGEVYMNLDEFARVNEEREAAGQSPYANPRNIVSGSLRMKDPRETAKRRLEIAIYQVNYYEGQDGVFMSQDGMLSQLSALGFKIPEHLSFLANGIQSVVDYTDIASQKRSDLPYEIDGLVVKVNNLEDQKRCGTTSHHPKWAIAYKFEAKQAHTQLENVEYQVGKTGVITPVAKIKPVSLAGVTISSVSLHNADFIQEKDLRLGDTVVVERAGDVIPYIVKVMTELRPEHSYPMKFPALCPISKTDGVPLIRIEGESAWRCQNCNCGAQNVKKAIYFVSKEAMDIDGVGAALVERLFELNWLESFVDLYKINYEKLASLDGYGTKSAEKVRLAVEKSKNQPLSCLLNGLCIHHMGKRASKLIASEINHIVDLFEWQAADYESIHDVGPVLAQNACLFFHDPLNQDMILELQALGLNMTGKLDKKAETMVNGVLTGKSILFTGSLTRMTRSEAQEIAESKGAQIRSSVSKKLDILVAGENAGSKLEKAQKIESIQILSEEEFLRLIHA